MATYTKETALYDTGAIGTAIGDVERQISIGLYGEDGDGGVVAQLALKIDKTSDSAGTDLVSNINAVADQITLSADQINFTGGGTVKDELDTLNTAISINTQDPSVTIGKLDNFYIIITPTEMGFYQQGGNQIAYMNGSELYVENSLSFGEPGFAFTQRQNGHFTLQFVD